MDNLFHSNSNLFFTGETQVCTFLPCTALQLATGRLGEWFPCFPETHICTFLANLPRGIRVTGHTPEHWYVWNLIKSPTKWDYLPYFWKHPLEKYLKAIKIQIIRILPFTMSFLGFMYFDIRLTLPKKRGQAFPRFWHFSAVNSKKMARVQPCFSIPLYLVLWHLFSCRRGLEKPLPAISGGMVLVTGIANLGVPTLCLWNLTGSSHWSESQGPQEPESPRAQKETDRQIGRQRQAERQTHTHTHTAHTHREPTMLLLTSLLLPYLLLLLCPLTPA